MTLSERFRRWYRLQAAGWLLTLRRPDGAHALYSRVLDDHPRDVTAMSCLAYLESVRGHRQQAIAGFERVLALDPTNVGAQYNRAFLLHEAGRHREAVAGFDAVLAHQPDHDLALYGKGLALIAAGQLDEAMAPLKRNTELQPMSPYGWYQLARIHVDLGDRAEAHRIIAHLRGFEPKVAAQLARETGISFDPV